METLLAAVLMRWQKDNGLPPESADEQLFRKGITQAQYQWLETFSRLWDLSIN